MLILWITLFSLLGSVGAIIAAAAFLLLREKIQKVLIPCLISFATGTLLAAALLGLISHALKNTSPLSILSTVLVGIVVGVGVGSSVGVCVGTDVNAATGLGAATTTAGGVGVGSGFPSSQARTLAAKISSNPLT